jgi:hypothetical protein
MTAAFGSLRASAVMNQRLPGAGLRKCADRRAIPVRVVSGPPHSTRWPRPTPSERPVRTADSSATKIHGTSPSRSWRVRVCADPGEQFLDSAPRLLPRSPPRSQAVISMGCGRCSAGVVSETVFVRGHALGRLHHRLPGGGTSDFPALRRQPGASFRASVRPQHGTCRPYGRL